MNPISLFVQQSPTDLSVFLPELTEHAKSNGVVILSRKATVGYQIMKNVTGVRFVLLCADKLIKAIEDAVADKNSPQFAFVRQLNDTFDPETRILGSWDAAENDLATTTADELTLALSTKNIELGDANLDEIKAKCTEKGGIVLVESEDEPEEKVEGALIQLVQTYLENTERSAPIYVFVDALHLVGINAQLGSESMMKIVPIELLVMYALYHETKCPGIARAWLLEPDSISASNQTIQISSPYQRTTYRNRLDLQKAVGFDQQDKMVIGVMSSNNDGIFMGFLTDSLDVRKLVKQDMIVAI